jgi:ATP-dependent Lhr-like helicase
MRDDLKIRELIPRVWSSFFSRFGKLREIQRKVIPLVISKKNLVVSSPTASGKTEAILAPLIELALEESWEKLSILWVTPTRALVNDLYMRFSSPLRELRINFDRKTGDHPSFNQEKPPLILITTPESFDSLLSRFPQSFRDLKALILDDIHLIDGTPRGDQVRVLKLRLKLISPQVLTYCLSATISNPLNLGMRYMEEFDIVESQEGRDIEFYLLQDSPKVWRDLFGSLRDKDVKKILLFVNSRLEAERVSRYLRESPLRDRVFVHHGSLSKSEREDIESFMNREKSGICVATTTLELGIDIGDIDAVVLYRPPFNIQSFLQRVGRGSRRRDVILSYGIFKDGWEKLLFEIYFEDSRRGILGEDVYEPSLSTAVQQILSYLYQRRKVGATVSVFNRILEILIEGEDLMSLLYYLEERGFIKRIREGVYAPDDLLIRAGERGWLHSNIDRKPKEYRVVRIDTGKEMGKIQLFSPQFELGGKFWEVVELDKNTAWVKPATGIFKAAGKVFKGKNLFWNFTLGKRIKEKLFFRNAENEYPYLKTGSHLIVFHLSGPVLGYLWQSVLRKRGLNVTDIEGRFMIADGYLEPEDLYPTERELNREIEIHSKTLGKFLSLGFFFRYLPKELEGKALSNALRIHHFLNHLEGIRYVEANPLDAQDAFEILMK